MTQADIGSELLMSLEALDREVKEVYRTLLLPTWGSELHGLPDALYGYMMGVFARVDLVSAYWSGSYAGNQTKRMVDFMDRYLQTDHEANDVAVQI